MKALYVFPFMILSALAQEEACNEEQNKGQLLDKIKQDLQDERLITYSKNDGKEYKIVKLDSFPAKVTSTSVSYKLPNLKLKPGECGYFNVPAQLRDKAVLFVNLGHTQSPEDNTGWDEATKWDSNPGLTSVQLNQSNDKGESRWRYWNGMASGKHGAKFAEPGHMELEGLYEWYHNGHSDIKTDTKSMEPLMTDAIRLCSVGKDTVTIGSIDLKVSPGKAATYKEFNFSASNKMGDSLTAEGREYGDKEGALYLGYGGSKGNLPAGWMSSGRRLEIPLEAGKKLKSFEAAVSDMHEDGKSGYARLNVVIQKLDGTGIPVIETENVPPEGVLIGSPEKDIVIEAGDKLIVQSQLDNTYIMGMKLGLD